MKTGFSIVSFICLNIAFAAGCSKNTSSNGSGTTATTLTLSNQTVKIGQPLVVETNAAGSTLYTRWSVVPANTTYITNGSKQSVILFSKSGNYTVTASYYTDSASPAPYDSSSSPVSVSDSIYNDSAFASCNAQLYMPLSNTDLLTVTPVSYTDSGLVFLVHTQNSYGTYSPSLGQNFSNNTDSGFNYNLPGVTTFPCNAASVAPTPATGSLYFFGLGNGSYPFYITANGKTYAGTVTTTASACTIAWSYTSGVVISPLSIPKQ